MFILMSRAQLGWCRPRVRGPFEDLKGNLGARDLTALVLGKASCRGAHAHKRSAMLQV